MQILVPCKQLAFFYKSAVAALKIYLYICIYIYMLNMKSATNGRRKSKWKIMTENIYFMRLKRGCMTSGGKLNEMCLQIYIN